MTLSNAQVAGVVILVVACVVFWLRRRVWPFENLKQRGTHRSGVLPTAGDAFVERKRDFSRIAQTNSGLLVVTPASGDPKPWTCRSAAAAGTDSDTPDAVFEEFSEWLLQELMASASGCPMTEGLASRIVASVAVGETIGFAMAHKVQPFFPQSKFVLVLSRTGEARVLWLAFATDQPKPNMKHTPYIVKLVTDNLNCSKVAAEAATKGVAMEYCGVHTSATDLDEYLRRRQAGALSRASIENCWDDVLGTV
eukprot:TRINITY_DN10471_c0_g1_i1.p1 TRINITY_DN10471_c0_g1~~TRINITY_DN10471_c0_g1_i1.p1  ORF type:complete len:252 (+),score=41.65 TRINITY_DN10471_c0_g1_i1:71-826(+)